METENAYQTIRNRPGTYEWVRQFIISHEGVRYRFMKKLFGLKRGNITGGWKKLHNNDLRHLSFSPSILRGIRSRRNRLAKHGASMGDKKRRQGFDEGT
jgi:hypothetical protein